MSIGALESVSTTRKKTDSETRGPGLVGNGSRRSREPGQAVKQTRTGMTPSGPTWCGSVPALPALAMRPTCGVCVTTSGQWFWVAESLGFRVAWVWARKGEMLPMWLREEFLMAHFTTVAVHLSPVGLVLCDSLAPGWVLDAPEDYPRLVSSRNLIKDGKGGRVRAQQGTFRYVKLRHADLGGLTERSQTIRFWSVDLLKWEEHAPPSYLPSMVYSVASDAVDVG